MTNAIRLIALAGSVFAAAAMPARAAEVTVQGVHLCCPACERAVLKALEDVEGVSQTACNRDSKLVGFRADGDKSARAGIDALAEAGFHGTATHGGQKLAFPDSGAKKGDRADRVTLAGVHLCCGACVTGARKSVEEVAGIAIIDIDRNARTVTLTGKAIDVAAAVRALNAGGFHGTVKPPKP